LNQAVLEDKLMSKEIFSFEIRKPIYSFQVSLAGSGQLRVKEVQSGKTQETEKKMSEPEMDSFFSELEGLGFYSWPPNLDCCGLDDSTWTVMADFQGKKKNCFGVFGFEPDTWPDLVRLVEKYAGKKVRQNA